MIAVTLLTALFSSGLAFAVLIINSQRFLNQVLASLFFLQAIWLGSIFGAMHAGLALEQGRPTNLEFWLRTNAIILSFLPFILSLLIHSITIPERGRNNTIVSALPVLGLCLLLVTFCFSDSFFSKTATGELRRGISYYIYNFIGILFLLTLTVSTRRKIQNESGIRRIELQSLGLNAAIAGLLIVSLTTLGNYFAIRPLNRSSVIVVFLTTALTAWSLVVHRVFNTKQVFLVLGHRLAVAALFGAAAWGLSTALGYSMPATPAWLVSILFCTLAVFWVEKTTRFWLGIGEEKLLSAMRRDVIELSRQEASTDKLTSEIEKYLVAHHQAGFARIMGEQGDRFANKELALPKNRVSVQAFFDSGWTTPESLQRRRTSKALGELAKLLAEHSIGVLISIPRGSPTPSLLIALGTKTNGWPYTYPEVERLQNIAELIDNTLTHSRLTNQAALQAKMEHLAMMSRGLAHDLKNLITPVSSFLIHTEGHLAPGTPEADVHAAARHSIRVMTDYLREALFFSERLAPKLEPVVLETVFNAVVKTTADRAATHRIRLLQNVESRAALVADGVLLQRMLVNLVNNAFDASQPGQVVTISVNEHRNRWLRIQVTDQGSGIAAEHLGRIFDPYFTTKEFGDDVRGFGLGLTICEKIANLHGGVIEVQSELGNGTCVSVDLPLDGPPRGPVQRLPGVALS